MRLSFRIVAECSESVAAESPVSCGCCSVTGVAGFSLSLSLASLLIDTTPPPLPNTVTLQH